MTLHQETQMLNYRDWKGWNRKDFAVCTREDFAYFSAETAGLRDEQEPHSWLEIGFGNGAFLHYARSCNISVVGTEIDPELVDRAVDAGFNAYHSANLDEVQEHDFSAVFAFDVLEHIPVAELPEFLRRIRALLRPGGVLLARFPSGDSPFAGAMYNGDLTHETLIGSGMVRQLALGSDLEVVAIRAAALPVFGVGLRKMLRRLPVRIVRTIVSRLLNLVYYSNARRIIDPNMVIVLRRPDSR